MDPLSQLKTIQLGQSYGLWPLAYGWWILLTLLLAVIVVTIVYTRRRYKKRLAIRQALKQLDSYQSHDNWPQELNLLLKRLCISYFPTEKVASLHQEQWLDFLTLQLPAKKQTAFKQDYQLLLNDLYQQAKTQLELTHYQSMCRQWVKQALPPGSKQQQEAKDV